MSRLRQIAVLLSMTRTVLARTGGVVLSTLLGAAPLGMAGCDAKIEVVLQGDSGPQADGGPTALVDEDRPLVPASKVDILVVVDNSASMGDKSSALASSLGTFLHRVTPGKDVHFGVISSSLGNSGGDVCDETNPEANGRARLRTVGADRKTVAGAETGVLAYAGGSDDAFVASAAELVRGAGESGCGLEAQLEAMYRFLVQPDPWNEVAVPAGTSRAELQGVDETLLKQRRAFLRPDSAVVVLLITDEEDASLDPLSLNGQGWGFTSVKFPGSTVARADNNGTTAPRGTAACETDPASEACTSCALAPTDPSCAANGGYYATGSDDLNVRFFDMKRRFGVDPQFPIERYIDGLTKSVVPDRTSEHAWGTKDDAQTLLPYPGSTTCVSPLFAASLPDSASSELCALERGPRSRELVLFGVLGGVPKMLVESGIDWVKVLGKDPASYDRSGIDPHMIPSIEPRAGLPGPTAPATDPIHGREWDTMKGDLQYACTFELATPRTCTKDNTSCDCTPGSKLAPPLCAEGDQQVRGKAYPTHRPLRVAQGLGARAVVGSICATDYTSTMNALADRLATRLAP